MLLTSHDAPRAKNDATRESTVEPILASLHVQYLRSALSLHDCGAHAWRWTTIGNYSVHNSDGSWPTNYLLRSCEQDFCSVRQSLTKKLRLVRFLKQRSQRNARTRNINQKRTRLARLQLVQSVKHPSIFLLNHSLIAATKCISNHTQKSIVVSQSRRVG